jgi:hypothetical protein
MEQEVLERTGVVEEHLSTADLVRQDQSATSPATLPTTKPNGQHEPLFNTSETETFRDRWHGVQGGFVDEPRQAVQKADELVATVIKRLAEVFADERSKMEHDWAKGQDVSTEDLRQALRRYRSFFDRLLSV